MSIHVPAVQSFFSFFSSFCFGKISHQHELGLIGIMYIVPCFFVKKHLSKLTPLLAYCVLYIAFVYAFML